MIKYILLLLLTLTSCGPFSPFIQKPSNPLNPFDPLRHKPKSTLEQGLEKMNEMMELVKKYEQEFIIHFNELKEKAKEKVNANDLVHSINSQFTSIKNTIDKNNINQLNQLGIPQHAVEKFKAALFSQTSSIHSFSIELFPDRASAIEGIGFLVIQGKNAKVVYIEAHTRGELIEQKEPLKLKECHSTFLFGKSCTERIVMKTRGFTINELNLIKAAIRQKSASELQNIMQSIRNLQ